LTTICPANGLVGDLLNEIAGDGQCNIGFEQRHAHFAHRTAHVGLAQRAAPAKLVEHPAEAVAETVEHHQNSTATRRQRTKRRRAKPRRPACPEGP
jgi:hypothetical protein